MKPRTALSCVRAWQEPRSSSCTHYLFYIALQLRPDNATRWNSTFYMIERSLIVEERIRAFCRDERYHDSLKDDELSETEWADLRRIKAGLEPFRLATKRLEGNGKKGHHGSVWEVLPAFEHILDCLEQGMPVTKKQKASVHHVSCQNAWEKLRKYYNKTDDCHEVYAAAVLFQPRLRATYFDATWNDGNTTEIKQQMLNNVHGAWKRDYRDSMQDQTVEHVPKRQKRQHSPDAIELSMERAVANRQPIRDDYDDFERYIYASPTPKQDVGDNVIAWWARHGGSLTQQAFDTLSVPATSCEVERLFSAAGRLVTTLRGSLHDDTIERAELLKHWLDHDIVVLNGAGPVRRYADDDDDDDGDLYNADDYI
jgi:hypothetical protein